MINEVATGEMKDLIRDVGINSDMDFMSSVEFQKNRDNLLAWQSDNNFKYFANALFTPIDMTEYETMFTGFGEMSGFLPISGANQMTPYMEELLPARDQLSSREAYEKRDINARSLNHYDLVEAARAEAEADEEEEEDGDEYGSEGGDEEGDGEESEEEYGEEKPDPRFEAMPEDKHDVTPAEKRYFLHGEQLKDRFNEVELDAFMKLLNIRPS
mmetsp:Transcript_7241/g.6355  ORF Transcript_7241/g.6355 Transcript_7241/m.6355 type:complete len:214 (+) Transcript_7241:1560-2201(+)